MHITFVGEDLLVFDMLTAHPSAQIANVNGILDIENIEKSFTDGSDVVSKDRIKSSEIVMTFEIYNDTDTVFRADLNNVLYWARKTAYLVDTDSELRTKVSFSTYDVQYWQGGEKRGATVILTFIQETPFWEDSTEIEVTGSGSIISLNMNNTGYIQVPAIFTIDATVLTEGFSIEVTETADGISIADLAFGSTVDLLQYIIDATKGTAKLSGNDRNDRITGGSGFFTFPVGTFTLNLTATASVSLSVKYRRRFYL